MSDTLPPCPVEPDFAVDWAALDAAYDWIRNLRGCPQDPIYHAEGDVWIHTRMVCEELAALPAWRALAPELRRLVFAAALLHDTGKPDCTRHEPAEASEASAPPVNTRRGFWRSVPTSQKPRGRISSRGHSRRGSILARRLRRLGAPFAMREQVCGLVRFHQAPYFLIDREDARRLVLEISQSARCDHLALLAEADVRGRICADQQRLLDNVALFAEYAREQGCLERSYAFPSEQTRFLYFQQPGRVPEVPAFADFKCEAVLMAGLPGSGKDHWIKSHLPDWPLISLDDIRAELDVAPTDSQGEVISHARELAREYLRKRVSFVWNATNLSRQLRRACINLFAGYGARVRIVYREVPAAVLFAQNRNRSAVVPEQVIERLLDRWEVPDPTEAHQVEYAVS